MTTTTTATIITRTMMGTRMIAISRLGTTSSELSLSFLAPSPVVPWLPTLATL
jgi:hypothetical protein